MKNLLFFLLVCSFHSCCKDCDDPMNPDCSNYNPCFKYPKRAANFKIYENPGSPPWYWEFYEYDTIVGKSVLFIADFPEENGVEYIWTIGSEILYGRSVSRDNFPDNESIPIKLIVNHPSKSCYGNKKSDTFIKSFYSIGPNSSGSYINHRLTNFYPNYPINHFGNIVYGKAWIAEYRGAYINNPKYKDSFTIRYQQLYTGSVRYDTMFNLPYPGCIQLQNNALGSYNYFWYGSGFANNSQCMITEKNKSNYLFKLDRFSNDLTVTWKNETGDSLVWIGKKIN